MTANTIYAYKVLLTIVLQSIAQLSARYGRNVANAIQGGFNTAINAPDIRTMRPGETPVVSTNLNPVLLPTRAYFEERRFKKMAAQGTVAMSRAKNAREIRGEGVGGNHLDLNHAANDHYLDRRLPRMDRPPYTGEAIV